MPNDTANQVGRPPAFENPQDMQVKIDAYFADPPTKQVVGKDGSTMDVPIITITGLCYELGFDSRQSFYDYEKKTEFTYTIKRARLFIENEYEAQLKSGNVTGAIFALKNFGWSDKTEQEIYGKGGGPVGVTFVGVNAESD